MFGFVYVFTQKGQHLLIIKLHPLHSKAHFPIMYIVRTIHIISLVFGTYEKMFADVEDKKVENTTNKVATTSSSPQVQKAKLILKVQPEDNLIQVSKI